MYLCTVGSSRVSLYPYIKKNIITHGVRVSLYSNV
nr:MAG TPA: hypothetical protein [Caudoviricetes sp.]